MSEQQDDRLLLHLNIVMVAIWAVVTVLWLVVCAP